MTGKIFLRRGIGVSVKERLIFGDRSRTNCSAGLIPAYTSLMLTEQLALVQQPLQERLRVFACRSARR